MTDDYSRLEKRLNYSHWHQGRFTIELAEKLQTRFLYHPAGKGVQFGFWPQMFTDTLKTYESTGYEIQCADYETTNEANP
jgi:hypothetical protein